jgi:EF-hand domain pair/EF hand
MHTAKMIEMFLVCYRSVNMKNWGLFGGGLLLVGAALAMPVLAQRSDADWQDQPQKRSDAEAKARAHFAKLDANHDGSVTATEAEGVREERRDEARAAHFEAMDRNKDGQISRAEFDAGHEPSQVQGVQNEPQVRGGRRGGSKILRADRNGDGKVTEAEMVGSVLARFDSADANKDGVVSVAERRASRAQMRGQRRGKGRS